MLVLSALCPCVLSLLLTGQSPKIDQVVHDGSQIVLRVGAGKGPIRIKEFGPQEVPGVQTGKLLPSDKILAANEGTPLEIRIDAAHRALNGFALVNGEGQPLQPTQFATRWSKALADPESGLPANLGVKGLQVQMIDDAIDLGVHHAALNLDLASLVRIPANAGDRTIIIQGQSIGFRAEVLQGMSVNRYSDQGIRVYLIILAYRSGNPAIDSLLLHPSMLVNAPNRLGAFNTETADGAKVYAWLLEGIADFFSNKKEKSDSSEKTGPNKRRGQVAGWIIGNEVNAHHEWYNRGPADPEQVVGDYHRALRIAHAVLKASGNPGRVYVSLEHHWTAKPGRDPKQSLPGREFLSRLLELSRKHGDFDWNLAYHPYPSNLFEPRSWLDRDATASLNSPKITFKNLEQLARWSDLPDSRFAGKPRRIILSEQGFHSPPGVEGEKNQAAGFVFAWKKVRSIAQIDAFIVHRHVDHAIEGGLNLGLWTNKAGQICTPDQKKAIWQVFQAAGTPAEALAFEPFRAVMGEKVWQSVEPKKP